MTAADNGHGRDEPDDTEEIETTPPATRRRDWRDFPPSLETLHEGLVTVDGIVTEAVAEATRREGRVLEEIDGMRGVLLRVESVVVTLAARQLAADRDTKREHAWTDEAMAKLRADVRHAADDSTQRIAMTSQHEIDRVLANADKASDQLAAEAKRSLEKIDGEAKRAIDRIDGETADEVKARRGERIEHTKAKWALVAVVVGVLASTGSSLLTWYLTHEKAPVHALP